MRRIDLPALTEFIGEATNFNAIGFVTIESRHASRFQYRHSPVDTTWNRLWRPVLPEHLFPTVIK